MKIINTDKINFKLTTKENKMGYIVIGIIFFIVWSIFASNEVGSETKEDGKITIIGWCDDCLGTGKAKEIKVQEKFVKNIPLFGENTEMSYPEVTVFEKNEKCSKCSGSGKCKYTFYSSIDKETYHCKPSNSNVEYFYEFHFKPFCEKKPSETLGFYASAYDIQEKKQISRRNDEKRRISNLATTSDWRYSLGCYHDWEYDSTTNMGGIEKKWYDCKKCGSRGSMHYSPSAGYSYHIIS